MMRAVGVAALLICVLAAQIGWAAGPAESLRPTLRPVVTTTAPAPPPAPDVSDAVPVQRPVLRPARPDAEADATPRIRPEALPSASDLATDRSLRPNLRSTAVMEAALAQRRLRLRGAICGDVDIQGEIVGRVPGRIEGCGIREAVRVRAVSGVTLSQQAVMDCTTARALNTWVTQSAKPALRRLGGGLRQLRVAAHYACRTRNNQPGARISEHGKGRAIDISGFFLADGSLITVREGWTARQSTQALRQMHRGACGPFGTVLGPDADRFHLSHFHFDTARYRGGSYCR